MRSAAVIAFIIVAFSVPAYALFAKSEPTIAVRGTTIELTFHHAADRCAGEPGASEVSVDLLNAGRSAQTTLTVPIDAITVDCATPRRWTATFDVWPWARRAHVPPGVYSMTVWWGARTDALKTSVEVRLDGPVAEPTPPSDDAESGVSQWKLIAFLAFDVAVVAAVIIAVRRRRARRAS